MSAKSGNILTLPYALKFEAADLAANQTGMLTSHQRQNLRQQVNHLLFNTLILLVIALVLLSIPFLAEILPSPTSPEQLSAMLMCFWVLYAPFMALFGGLTAYALYLLWQDAHTERPVQQITGYINRKKHLSNETFEYRYLMLVKDVEFKVSLAVYYAFQEGQLYNVYYLPRSQTLLSAEPVEAG